MISQPVAWQAEAICADLDDLEADRIFFPERGGSSKAARAMCARCPSQAECLEYALDNKEAFGIWGGTSERERRKLRKAGTKRAA
ncbi:MAG: WhiB family transcriptional regulator [Actinomycetota bacterium]